MRQGSLQGDRKEEIVTLENWRPDFVIDSDIHIELPSLETLFPYLPDHWIAYINESAFNGPDALDYPANAPTTRAPYLAQRTETYRSQKQEIAGEVLDVWNTDIGILNCTYWTACVHNEDLAASLSTALNRWIIDEWLDVDDRFRASLVVPSQNPLMAAEEIERFGDHPGFVQILLPVRAGSPYGTRRYDPIYQAAVAHDLVVGIHYGGAPGHAPTPTGWPSRFVEEYAGMAQVFQSQLLNLITEGAFDRFPDLRVALLEGGFTWLPPFLWRFDKEWKGLRHNTPWVRRPPSAYVADHVRLTTQPVDRPNDDQHFAEILEQLESDELLLFSSDYPHWHFDRVEDAFPAALSRSSFSKIMGGNARAFYRL